MNGSIIISETISWNKDCFTIIFELSE